MKEERGSVQTVGLVFFCTFAVLTMTTLPLSGPFIFGDECIYSLTIQEGWNLPSRLSNSVIPNYLFYAIYHVAFLAQHAQSLTIARILNALLLSATAVIFFMMLRTPLRAGEAFVLSIGITLTYLGIFSLYFMAESLFFFFFWLTVYCYYFVDSHSLPIKAMIVGVLTGLLALTKPHGYVVAAGWISVLLVDPYVWGATDRRSRAASVPAFLVAFLFSCLLGSYVITGTIPLDPVGPFYRFQIKTGLDTDSVVSAARVGIRHLGFLALFFSFPLYIVTSVFGKPPAGRTPLIARLLFAGVTFSLLLIAMSTKLTVDIADIVPYDSLGRSHMRYYLVSLPLFVIPFFLCARQYVHEFRSRERLL